MPMRFELEGRVGRRGAVVADPRRSLRGHGEVHAVVPPVDAERLAELRRPAAERSVGSIATSRGAHRGNARDRRERTKQHRSSSPSWPQTALRAPVHAVGEVHVQVAGRAEHGGVASREAAIRVARGIVGAEIGLDLDDAAPARAADQDLVEQVGATSRASRRKKSRPRGFSATAPRGPRPARASACASRARRSRRRRPR